MINAERLTRRFIALTRFDAESYEEQQISEYLFEQLTALGLQPERDAAGNLYAALKANTKGVPPVLLSSHMDTVSPGKGKKAVLHNDGRITSDGTTVLGADDASGLAEILEVLCVLQEDNLPHGDVEILFPAAEEPYAQGSRQFDYSKIKSKIAYVFDLDGEIGRAAVAAPSIISVKVTVNGKASHAGFAPEKGINAIAIASKTIASVQQGRIGIETTVNLGTIAGGTGRNIVPETCTVTGEIRSMDHAAALRQAKNIESAFAKAALSAGGTAQAEIIEELCAYRIERNEPVVRHYIRACEHIGVKPQLIETFGGSDNNHFTEHGIWGIVVANAMYHVHSTSEYTTVGEMAKAAEIALELVKAK